MAANQMEYLKQKKIKREERWYCSAVHVLFINIINEAVDVSFFEESEKKFKLFPLIKKFSLTYFFLPITKSWLLSLSEEKKSIILFFFSSRLGNEAIKFICDCNSTFFSWQNKLENTLLFLTFHLKEGWKAQRPFNFVSNGNPTESTNEGCANFDIKLIKL
jgi:hypothetical protein